MQWIQSLTYPMLRMNKVNNIIKVSPEVYGWWLTMSGCVYLCHLFWSHSLPRLLNSSGNQSINFFITISFSFLSILINISVAQVWSCTVATVDGWRLGSQQTVSCCRQANHRDGDNITLGFHSVSNLFSTFCRKSTLATNQECTLNSVPMH